MKRLKLTKFGKFIIFIFFLGVIWKLWESGEVYKFSRPGSKCFRKVQKFTYGKDLKSVSLKDLYLNDFSQKADLQSSSCDEFSTLRGQGQKVVSYSFFGNISDDIIKR